ncbi:MAG: DUF1722 domain-containing protein [Nitrosopumilaceae archaeon]
MRKQITIDNVRSFTLEQFDKIKESNDIKKLVNFHTINKYLFLALDQSELKILGNLVANKNKNSTNKIFQEYEEHLKKTLTRDVTLPSTANVLIKIYSKFKKKFTSDEKQFFFKIIEDFKDEKISLGKVLNFVDKYIQKYENGYIQRQTFYLLYSDIEHTDFFKSFEKSDVNADMGYRA